MRTIFNERKFIGQLFFCSLSIIFFQFSTIAQPCTIGTPQLFGTPVDKIVCRASDAQLGVNGSVVTQQYFFIANNGSTPRSLGGPLIGNGDQLSVAARVASSADAGQYSVQTVEGSCSANNSGFYVYYGDIDDLTITSWGNNSVSFSWASSGRSSYVKYEYAVSTVSDPFNIPDADTATTYNTSATVSGLVAGITYYIHVSVFEVYKQPYGGSNGAQVDNQCFGSLPWQTRMFKTCAAATSSNGSISPINAVICTGSNINLTAPGGALSYQWYKDGTIINPNGNNATLNVTSEGIYSTYITKGSGCEGMAYSKLVIEKTTLPGIFSGGGTFCAGDQVRLGISRTKVNQAYEIRNNGQLVATLNGIGTSQGFPSSEDTVWHNFTITSPTQAGNYTVTTYNNVPCQSITFGNQNVVLLSSGSVGAISGSTTVAQNNATYSNITFTGSGGQVPYTFTYKINGGPDQTITTTGINATVIVPQSNATLGSFIYTLVKVTDASGCMGSIPAPVTATITVTTGSPDVTNSQFFSTTQVAAGGSIQEVIGIRNVGAVATSAPTVFTVTNYSALTGLTAISNNSPSVTIGFTTYVLSNVADWDISSSASALTFTSKPGVIINPGTPKYIGITINRLTGANGSVSHSSTLSAGTGGGDSQNNNNSISNTLLKN